MMVRMDERRRTPWEQLCWDLAVARETPGVIRATRAYLEGSFDHRPWQWWRLKDDEWRYEAGGPGADSTPTPLVDLERGWQEGFRWVKDRAPRPFVLSSACVLIVDLSEREAEPHKDAWNVIGAAWRRAAEFEDALRLTTIDETTGLFNARHMLRVLEHELARSRRFHRELSLLFIDLDHFKAVNDELGHMAGTQVLTNIGRLIADSIRRSDHGFRYGGDEFAVCLVETGRQRAMLVADRIRQRIRDEAQHHTDSRRGLTASIGVASFPGDGDSLEGLLDRADAAMYAAKAKGRDTVYTLDLAPEEAQP
jgi:diguanylate cyclase (GGDEF)-like protein